MKPQPSPKPGADRNNRSHRIILTCLTAAFLSPLLLAGLYFDDLVLAVAYYDASPNILKASGDAISAWWSHGRFFPINVVLYEALFRYVNVNHHLVYHIAQVAAIAGCFALFVRYTSTKLGGNPKTFGLIATLLLLTLTTIRPVFHDPFVSYHFQQPLFFLFIFTSIILFDRYLQDATRHRLLVGSLALYATALCIYEIAYPLILVFFVLIALKQPRKTGLWVLYGSLFILLVVFQLYLRKNANSETYQGTSLSASPLAALSTFVNQIYCTLPLSWLSGKILIAVFNKSGTPSLRILFDLLFMACLAALSIRLAWRAFRAPSHASHIAFLGLLLWVLPAVPIALSAKYQVALSLTTGYLPRFIQHFGLALILLPWLVNLKHKKVVITSLGFIATMVFAYNVYNIQKANAPFTAARLIHDILEDQAFLDATAASRIYVLDGMLYESAAYLHINPGIPVIEKDPALLRDGDNVLLIHPDTNGRTFAYWGTWQDDGTVRDLYLAKRADPANKEDGQLQVNRWLFTPVAGDKPFDDLVREVN